LFALAGIYAFQKASIAGVTQQNPSKLAKSCQKEVKMLKINKKFEKPLLFLINFIKFK
jgi:hypothetical protein